MRIGVITLFSQYAWDNYGGTLQNYALVNYLNRLGHEAYTIAPIHRTTKYLLYDKFSRFIYHQLGIRLERKGKILKPVYIGVQKERNDSFKEFVRKLVPIKYYWIKNDTVYKKIEAEYEAFIVGSDQVWNTYFAINADTQNDYLLKFAPPSKRFSYAASFGTSEVNPEWKNILKSELKKFKLISVREQAGKEIIQNLTGISAEEVIDPTLLLSRDEWETVGQKPGFLNDDEEYLVTYFLGEKTESAVNDIKNIGESNNLKIYNLFDKENEEIYRLGPGEFLYMIKHAKIVLTDSFHACVFSFLFERPFLVYDRIDKMAGKEENMSSRVETFLNKFCLQRKMASNKNVGTLFECDYSEGKSVLETERTKAREFLMKIN